MQENGLGGEERKYKAVLIFYFGKIYFGKPIWDKVKKIHRIISAGKKHS